MILPHLSPVSHLTRVCCYCRCWCLLLFGHWYPSYSHVCNLEGLIFNVIELLTQNFGPQIFQQAANNKIILPDFAYVLLRTGHIYLYCYPTTLHIVTDTAGAFIILWNELLYSLLIAVYMPWYQHHITPVTITQLSSKFWPPRIFFCTGHKL